jgi:hypothetical protein
MIQSWKSGNSGECRQIVALLSSKDLENVSKHLYMHVALTPSLPLNDLQWSLLLQAGP